MCHIWLSDHMPEAREGCRVEDGRMFPGANEVCALMVATAGKAVGVTLVCRPLQALYAATCHQ